jgi:hypothetical protein
MKLYESKVGAFLPKTPNFELDPMILESATSGKAGGLICEPLKAVVLLPLATQSGRPI